MWTFLQYVPLQFAFGAVQLVLNLWICLPRLALIGCKEDYIGKRVDNGWSVVSIGVLLLMPVVFAEMLSCDSFLKAVGGHFVYDGSVLLMSTIYSRSIWQQDSSKPD